MVPLHDALSIVDAAAREFDKERVNLNKALGRLLVRDVTSPINLPPFSRAAMDGFAVRQEDVDRELEVVEVVAAGQIPANRVTPGCAVQIMTGAVLPKGADRVVRVEFSELKEGRVRFISTESSTNIVWEGENGKRGDLLVSPRRLSVHDIGTLASLGLSEVEVLQQPKVGIISTGDEVREPGEDISLGEIYNSNACQLLAHATHAGFAPHYYGIAADSEDALTELLEPAITQNDIIVLSGGVSMGEFDYVPRVLHRLGVDVLFHRVAMKPGRPTLFGRREGGPRGTQYLFGLPGNPVSTFVTFELFAVRLLYRMAGLAPPVPSCYATMATTVKKRDPDRTEFVPVALREGVAFPVAYGGSSHLNALSAADGLLQMDVEVKEIKKGSRVAVRSL